MESKISLPKYKLSDYFPGKVLFKKRNKMPGKFFCNDPNNIVPDVMKGMKYTHPGLFFSIDNRIVLLNKDRGDRVAILAGSGAGHEPYPIGFVGENMLTGCVVGDPFKPPTVPSIINAILNLSKSNKGGVIIIGLNYTGNALNFWIAAKRAIEAGVKVGVVIMTDGVGIKPKSLKERHSYLTLKRGLCGAIMCAKIVGGMSSAGLTLEEILRHGNLVQFRTATISSCYGSCQLPSDDWPLLQLRKNEILIGLGAHGEEGLKRVKMAPLKEIVQLMVEQIFSVFLVAPGDKVVLMVNNSGICTEMELFTLAREMTLQLASKVLVVKTFVGQFFTSLNMKGFQINITNITCNEVWLEYINLSTEAFGWPGNKLSELPIERSERDFSVININKLLQPDGWKLNYDQAHIFGDCIRATCYNFKKHEAVLNHMDTLYSLGNFGTRIKIFSDKILRDVKGASLLMDLSKTFLFMAQIAEEEIDSIFGTVLAVMFTGASKGKNWASVWQEALNTLSMYSTARLYHRTLLDALIPAYLEFKAVLNEQGPHCWNKALKNAMLCAEMGSEGTVHKRPKTWIELQGTRALTAPTNEEGTPDPGAYLVTLWLKSITTVTSKEQRFLTSKGN